jgi:hypothetical protein
MEVGVLGSPLRLFENLPPDVTGGMEDDVNIAAIEL